jgi:hypothetical protein
VEGALRCCGFVATTGFDWVADQSALMWASALDKLQLPSGGCAAIWCVQCLPEQAALCCRAQHKQDKNHVPWTWHQGLHTCVWWTLFCLHAVLNTFTCGV